MAIGLQANDALHRRFRYNVRQLMTERDISMNHLADFSGIARGRMSEMLSGRGSPSLRTVQRIADALDVQLHDLLCP